MAIKDSGYVPFTTNNSGTSLMSMHKKPLTPIEEAGLKAHGLGRDIGKPSQLVDVFRQGVAWGLANAAPNVGLPVEVVPTVTEVGERNLRQYKPENFRPEHRWTGVGEPPAYWFANGVKIYRSYADYCDI